MSVIKNLKVFLTPPHPCSYLEDREATTLFIDPKITVSELVYSELNEVGFRRSGQHFYTPHCHGCRDCIATRIPVHNFQPSRKYRRIANRNNDLEVLDTDTIDTDEHYALYAQYIESRHDEGDMYPPTQEQYQQFIGNRTPFSCFTDFRLDGELIAVSVADDLQSCRSAIYTFFDPAHIKRSLGTFAILSAIDVCRAEGKDYLYLGYWIRDCRKMAYKIDFRPIELYIEGRWQILR
ncbi:MAG: arginyltransferase [Pseudomonadales bacterium]|nr:arginyltransferase [Pseudomonadales bacterium]